MQCPHHHEGLVMISRIYCINISGIGCSDSSSLYNSSNRMNRICSDGCSINRINRNDKIIKR